MDTNQLQLENEKLNARLEKAKEVFRQQAADIKAKDEAYLKLRDEYNEVVRERDIHIEANAKFNKQILEAEELIKELKSAQEKQQELADDSYDREVYVSQIDGLNDKIDVLSKEKDELTEAVKYWEERYHKLSEAHSTGSTELNDLKVRNNELETLATARLTDINKSKEEIEKLNNIIVELNNQYAALETKENEEYNALVLRYDDLTAEYNLLNAQFADLENEYNNSEELRISYTEATNKLNEEVSRLQDIIVSKDAAYKNLESTYNDFAVEHTRDVNVLKYTIEQLKKDLEDKDAKLVDACAKVGTLTHQLETETGKAEEVKTKTEEAVTSIKKKLQALNDGLGDEFNIFG